MQQPPSSRSRSFAITKLAIASTLAIGATAIATPALAVVFYDSNINFSSPNLNNFYADVSPVMSNMDGNDITLTMPSSVNVGSTGGTAFVSMFTAGSPGHITGNEFSVTATAPTLTYFSRGPQYTNPISGLPERKVDYLQPGQIVFDFTGKNLTLTIAPALVADKINSASVSLSNLEPLNSYFTDTVTGDRSYLSGLNFNINATSGNPNGNITIIAKTTPEPLTIIGTLLGGAAAIGIRKKLKSAQA